MKQSFLKHHTLLTLTVLTIVSFFLHFYNINWGAPFYFHPDERNIASSISQLRFPDRLNPNFFAYGSLPIYAIYKTGLVANILTECLPSIQICLTEGLSENWNNVLFEDAIVTGRIYSALFATLLTPLLFLIGKHLQNEKTGLYTAFLTTFSTGMIQFSHFTTFEMWTAFFVTIQLYLSLLYLKHSSEKTLYFLALITGILLSIKVSNAVLLIIPAITIILSSFQKKPSLKTWITSKNGLLFSILRITFLTVFALCLYALTNPFVFIDTTSFLGSIQYESEVALGTLHVFYTGEFYRSVPVIFHVTKVFPFLLSPLILLISVVSIFYVTIRSIQKKNQSFILLLVTFLVLFVSSGFMYVKWVRYMLPTLPFIYLMVSIFLIYLGKHGDSKLQKTASLLIIGVVFLSTVIFSLSYFITAFVERDTRLLARDFATTAIPQNARILSEVYDLGITPFNDKFHNIRLFNFYDLDTQHDEFAQELEISLSETDYIILPSQRILATRINNPDDFPKGNRFYTELIDNSQTYRKIYETPCSIFCKITYLGDPISRFEGTANVFDRPHIIIFKIQK